MFQLFYIVFNVNVFRAPLSHSGPDQRNFSLSLNVNWPLESLKQSEGNVKGTSLKNWWTCSTRLSTTSPFYKSSLRCWIYSCTPGTKEMVIFSCLAKLWEFSQFNFNLKYLQKCKLLLKAIQFSTSSNAYSHQNLLVQKCQCCYPCAQNNLSAFVGTLPFSSKGPLPKSERDIGVNAFIL